MGMIWLGVLVLGAVLLKQRREPRAVELLYRRGELVGNYAVFSCGCRFNYSQPSEPPKICSAHKALIDAEVAA